MQVKKFTNQMEKHMENIDLDSIYLSLKDSVNETLGDVAKYSIEGNNYQLLHIIAKIGIDVNTYIDGMFNKTTNAVAVIEAEIIDEPTTKTEVPAVPKKRTCVRGGYGVDIETAKNWTLQYLAKREGRALKHDFHEDYFKTFSPQFTALDYVLNSNKPRWKQNANHAVSQLRDENKIMKPKNGENAYYFLTPEELKNQKALMAQAQQSFNFSKSEGLTAEG